jgi:nucleotide-binding universal stress UspA family protein
VYRRIVVPLDGSELAANALVQARDAAETHNAPIVLVRAVDPPLINQMSVAGPGTNMGIGTGTTLGMVNPSVAYQDEDKEAREYIDREVQRLERDGFEASGIVVWGHAATAVANVINDTDLVVMSSLGRTGLRRWVLGSVAEDILKRTSVPVMIVRHPG